MNKKTTRHNNLQSTLQKNYDRTTRTPLKTGRTPEKWEVIPLVALADLSCYKPDDMKGPDFANQANVSPVIVKSHKPINRLRTASLTLKVLSTDYVYRKTSNIIRPVIIITSFIFQPITIS